MRSFYGNFGNLVRAYTYIRSLGLEGLRDVSAMAVLNANYMRETFKELGFSIPFDRINMHEFVAQPPEGLKTLDIAKALLDYGVHPIDRKSTRLNSSHVASSYAVFCLK